MKKILACVDGSDLSAPVLREAFMLAEANGAEGVEVLHVIDRDVEFPVLSAEFEDAEDPVGKIGQNVQAKIEGLMGSVINLVESPVSYRVNVVVGNPYKVIVKRARENGFDLVVMGHRGLKGLNRFLLGSVAAKVVPYAPCHVLVLRSRETETPEKVLVAVDGGEQSADVMAFGLDHALKSGAREVLFLNVVEEMAEVSHYYWGAFTVSPDFYEKATEGAREALEQILADLKSTRDTSGLILRTEVEVGRSHASIIEKAESEGTDLIVVGDRGKSGLEGFLLGSVSAKIVRYAPCGVLVYRTGRDKEKE